MRLGFILIPTLVLAACGGGATETASASGGSTSGATSTGAPTSSGSTGAPSCTPDAIICVDGGESVCSAEGGPGPVTPCTLGECVADVGCPVCVPGAMQCMGAEIQLCNAAGSGWEVSETCNAAQGLACDAATGSCVGACLPAELAKSGLTTSGCEFYAVTMVQIATSNADKFAVVIENPGDVDANITITQTEDFAPVNELVPAGTAKAIVLPWAKDLTSVIKGEMLYDGAYRIQSDQPVRAVQYSTHSVSASADSSTLWPRHTWGTSYYVATYDSTQIDANSFHRGAWTIVGGEDDTTVTVTARPGTQSKAGPGIGLDGAGVTKVGIGDALQIVSADVGDLTGAWLDATGPIQVFGAHACAFVPGDKGFCDHLEESMLPLDQLGSEYVVIPPVQHESPDARRVQVVRVIATAGATTLTYDPPQAMAPTSIPGSGEFVELPPSAEVYVLSADKPVLVAQYMVGSVVDASRTDPALLVTLPSARWHTSHYVHTLPDWLPLDLDIAAPKGATVAVGGAVILAWDAVGGSNYQVAHVRIDTDVGLSEVFADQPVAVNIYATRGELPASSFWHIGGGSLAP